MPTRWLLAALLFGLGYAVMSPPGRVPDEAGHFWHSNAVARGHFAPAHSKQPDFVQLPVGMKTFFWVLGREGEKVSLAQYRLARTVPHEPYSLVPTPTYPTHYTPVAYIPPALAALIARMLGLYPFTEFYLGRVVNLVAALALVYAAMRVAPRHANVFLAVALLPMTLFELASWSPDAWTFGLGVLFTAFMLEPPEPAPRSIAAVAVTALLLSLSKPAYFLIALLALFRPTKRRIAIAAIAATAVGIPIAMAYAKYAWYNAWTGYPIDPGEQLRCILAAPLRFVRLLTHDLTSNGTRYIAEMIGRLGWINVFLPSAVTALEVVLLAAVGLTAAPALDWKRRVTAFAIVIGTVVGIVTSQYLTWTVICSDRIDGVQGRYFLPLLPLALMILSLPSPRWRVGPRTIVAVAAVANVFAYLAMYRRYYS
ncbi:MAG: Protein of unknown function rane [Acidobacteria bacterium]|nr:Protein of unknown function rane [Acidobacteriota bacterium]